MIEFEVLVSTTSPSMDLLRKMFQEYADSLPVDLSFQQFGDELTGLPGDYGPPDGRLLLAWSGSRPAGCVALRSRDHETSEMKRLYVRPEFRGRGLGRQLVVKVMEEARSMGLRRMVLDTLASMSEAHALYRSVGFQTVPPYRFNPIPGAVFMECLL